MVADGQPTREAFDVGALADTLTAALVTRQGVWREIRVVAATGSTNADATAAARAGAREGLVVVADTQVAGRGRLGRTWSTPPGVAIAVSVLLRPAGVPAARWSWLPLLTGVAVVEAVRRVTEVPAVLKWPNDVLVGGRKLGGILAERVDTPEGSAAVVGIGINVSTATEQLPLGATSLAAEGSDDTQRDAVLVAVLSCLEREYAAWRADAGTAGDRLRQAYQQWCTTIGAHVDVRLPGGSYLDGTAVDVDPIGRLLVQTAEGERAIAAGDVVHVR